MVLRGKGWSHEPGIRINVWPGLVRRVELGKEVECRLGLRLQQSLRLGQGVEAGKGVGL